MTTAHQQTCGHLRQSTAFAHGLRSWSSGLQMNEEDRFSAVQRAPVSDAKPLKGAAPTPVAANGSRTSAWSIPGSGATIVSGGR